MFACVVILNTASVIKHGHDIDQLRGKVATAATHEVRKHAAAAAQAVAAAREATMELDKVAIRYSFKNWYLLQSVRPNTRLQLCQR